MLEMSAKGFGAVRDTPDAPGSGVFTLVLRGETCRYGCTLADRRSVLSTFSACCQDMAESPADGAETALVVAVSERPSMALGLGSSLRTTSLSAHTCTYGAGGLVHVMSLSRAPITRA